MKEILYGRQPVLEVLRAGRRQLFRLLLARELNQAGPVGQILRLAEQRAVPVQLVDRQELDKLGSEAHHQGVAAEVSGYPYEDPARFLTLARQAAEDPLLLLLDHVLDPQNLGSLLRSAEAAGVHGVIIPDRRAASVTPAAVRASAGASEHLHVAQVTNLVRAMEAYKAQGVWMVGLESLPQARLYNQADLRGPLGLVVGSEGQGLARLVRETCDLLIRLPMYGQVASLNAAVAGAIALYEIRRQRSL